MPGVRVWIALGILLSLSSAGCLQGVLGPDRPTPYDIIRDETYTEWIIEVDSVAGVTPPQDALNHMKAQVSPLVRKDIDVRLSDGDLQGRSSWSDAQLQDLNRFQDAKTNGDTVVTHVVYVDGEYAPKTSVLGVAYGHFLVIIFGERIQEGCADGACLLYSPQNGHRAVLTHEIGHILGLVDNGIPMVNNHSDGGAHSNNRNSVMWAEARTSDIFFLNTIPTTFDSNDKLDICAAGGKGSC